MEAEQAIKLTDKILNFLSKIKCKLMCCCKSSCSMDPQTNNENILEL
jgi:hypothetical protein